MMLNREKIYGNRGLLLLILYILASPVGLAIGWMINGLSDKFNAIALSF